MFQITKKSKNTRARTGKIITSHGEVSTPVFMPVATQGTVKTISNDELRKIGTELFIANTYHLYLRPGMEIIKQSGGLHKFINWERSIITDSGGFQVYSMSELRKISTEGVSFQSHIDGSTHFFSPENVIDIQIKLGTDIMMCFDECPPYPSTYDYTKSSMELTLNWAKRCKQQLMNSDVERPNLKQLIFGIVQGSTHMDLRKESALRTVDLDFDGYAIGGLAVGEPQEISQEIIDKIAPLLPENKPRYAMGIGTPEEIWSYIEQGIDMFDCVLPTRNGRNGQALTFSGKLNIRNAEYAKDFRPLDEDCTCPVCVEYSRAYIHHIFRCGELLSLKLLSLHNVFFMLKLTDLIKKSILEDNFDQEKVKFIGNYLNANLNTKKNGKC
ncbi:MAG: tRNA guanosine(34) transglycosylase Tgt [Elusimicrobia bacterium RIFOXYA2_FULL_40_6]|nr:MAG: tRNA guanosine(34) transglycosylase Tgt [Elusimicrobia bacterium RIFOXYA2_FULL_40_6]